MSSGCGTKKHYFKYEMYDGGSLIIKLSVYSNVVGEAPLKETGKKKGLMVVGYVSPW